jgi:hypothetical protein
MNVAIAGNIAQAKSAQIVFWDEKILNITAAFQNNAKSNQNIYEFRTSRISILAAYHRLQ